MSFWEAPPGPDCDQIVERISFSSDESPPPAAIAVPADSGTDLLLSIQDGAASLEVFGAKTRALLVQDDSPAEKMALHLRPGTASRVFGVAAHELRDRCIPADVLWGSRAEQLLERALDATSWRARRDLLVAAVNGAVGAKVARVPEFVPAALREISRTRAPISEIARRVGTSPRSLERGFRQHIGISPKTQSCIFRFREAARRLERGVPAADVAVAMGYADQPHMVREFKKLGGATPYRWT